MALLFRSAKQKSHVDITSRNHGRPSFRIVNRGIPDTARLCDDDANNGDSSAVSHIRRICPCLVPANAGRHAAAGRVFPALRNDRSAGYGDILTAAGYTAAHSRSVVAALSFDSTATYGNVLSAADITTADTRAIATVIGIDSAAAYGDIHSAATVTAADASRHGR